MDLSSLGRKCFISQRALEEVLTYCKENPDELQSAGTSRSAVKRSREAAFAIQTPYGPIEQMLSLKAKDGGNVNVTYLAPGPMLCHACHSSAQFGECVDQMLSEHHVGRQLTLCLYSDEISPGNNLKRDNRRRVQAIYWSIQELGCERLCMEASWFIFTVVRSETIAKKVAGGMSQLARECFRAFYRPGCDFRSGVQLALPGGYKHIMAKVGYILGDESALKQWFECKGTGGKLMCFFCKNCVNKRYCPEDMTGLVDHTSLEVNRLKLHSDRSIYDFVKYLKDKAVHLNRHDLEELETAIGFNHVPEGLLQDESLDIAPISSTAFDPMHVYLVAGLFHIEVTLLLQKLGQTGVRHLAIDRFLQDITWPAVVQSSGTSCKSAFAKKVEDTFKSTAGEALALYPVLRLFLSITPVNNAITRPAIKSFYSLCAVLDSLRPAAAGQLTGASLLAKIRAHLQNFQVIGFTHSIFEMFEHIYFCLLTFEICM